VTAVRAGTLAAGLSDEDATSLVDSGAITLDVTGNLGIVRTTVVILVCCVDWLPHGDVLIQSSTKAVSACAQRPGTAASMECKQREPAWAISCRIDKQQSFSRTLWAQ
jgi:hypothetical protein